MRKKDIILITLIVLLAGALVYTLLDSRSNNEQDQNNDQQVVTVNSFDECVEAGFPVRESYPAQCTSSGGKSFTQDIGNELELKDQISVDSPRPNQEVSSPLTLKGQARGYWYFEASFPYKLVDANGKILAQGPVQADGEWMTTEFVPFEMTVEFEKSTTPTGTLIINNDNPSGLPENQKELRIPIKFK